MHEINFLAFGKSFNTRLAMTANPANHTVRFDLLSSNLYRHYTTTFTTLPDTTSGTDSSKFANSNSSAALEHGVMGHLGSGDLDCPGGDVQPVDLDNATTVVRLEGSLAFQVGRGGGFMALQVAWGSQFLALQSHKWGAGGGAGAFIAGCHPSNLVQLYCISRFQLQ